MKIPAFIVAAMFASVLAIQGWTMATVVELKVKVAEIQAQMHKP